MAGLHGYCSCDECRDEEDQRRDELESCEFDVSDIDDAAVTAPFSRVGTAAEDVSRAAASSSNRAAVETAEDDIAW